MHRLEKAIRYLEVVRDVRFITVVGLVVALLLLVFSKPLWVGALEAGATLGGVLSAWRGERRILQILSLLAPERHKQSAYRAFGRLARAADWLPGAQLRKRVKKMIADEAAHAVELQEVGRFRAARWIAICAWVHAIAIAFRAPFAALLDLVKRSAA